MSQNQSVYEQSGVAQSWYSQLLQPAEAYLFIKYGAEISNKSVLDIGCGAGRTSFYLRKIANDYLGVDYSSAMIEVCKEKFPDSNFEVADVRDMNSLTNSSFDTVIFSFNGLDSVDHEGRLKGLAEIKRVLKSRGLFIFSAHNRNFERAVRRPTWKFSINPYRTARSLIGWWTIDMRNHRENVKHEIQTQEFEIRNDSSHRWRMLHYYIDRQMQRQQLELNGFELLDCVDCHGVRLSESCEDKHSGTVYYAARKKD